MNIFTSVVYSESGLNAECSSQMPIIMEAAILRATQGTDQWVSSYDVDYDAPCFA